MSGLYLVTKNQGKLMAAKNTFDKYNTIITSLDRNYPEIQAESSLEVARFTALQAAKEINSPVIREDHSLFIHVLGIPGPYTNYIEKKISAEKLLEILKNFNDRTGHFEIATVYAEPDGKTFEYVFQVPVTFGKEIKGNNPRGWNGLIRIGNESRAITEYSEEERLHIWSQGYEAVAKYIANKQ
ncbi:MAG: non-canonical purine NTP pyrophosphatase [Patescibacteria group bacterium]|nr:non-canonical purine NTP pyrophosphatase [Patescibacteria group bacterium]